MILTLENISKTYQNGASSLNVLSNITLSIESSESVAIVGPSGSGKSTLLNILGTLDTDYTGILKFDNENIKTLNEQKLAKFRNKKIGFIFQTHHLLPQLNLLENILLPTLILKDKNLKKQSETRALELINSVGLFDKIKQYPGQLSGGECQRTAVIRALINKPDLLLADEPTGSLDNESADNVGNLLASVNKLQNTTLIVVTHSVELAGKMNKSYKLVNGKLISF
ncbi:MAG: hypothetical protein A2033_14205 [Bacteroidetes bacterium GWA2_31_9]|nr:MAG: hypothetical protein A2033_14205 [Bacteroidetes bacterium GWA2_31_9]